jgi:hypothetical protein
VRQASRKATLVASRLDAEASAGRPAKVEGRENHAEKRPEMVALAKALAQKKPKGGRLRLRAISAELVARGVLNEQEAVQPKVCDAPAGGTSALASWL